jgi:NADPH-dependent glutamate synthase beta subunit-like oxidoreductase/coenzyme F420-reducing hydrogenase delta subunit/NAD-dependent dihydropyrimidine dehydrogenase PreA subunit
MNGNAPLDLANTGLVIPTLQNEPLPIAQIKPSPCTLACPAGINVKAYVSLIAEGRFAQALEMIRKRCPLPAICGRICHHPCEKACRRARYDDAVSIRALKRFVADHERDTSIAPPPPVKFDERIAVVGSGPAGLTAAYDLRLAGYCVTIFESENEPGGMLRYGIADYRLPADVLDAEIGVLLQSGIEIRTNQRVGVHVSLDQLQREYAAVLLAVGAQRGRNLGLKGEESTPEVQDALSFLRGVKTGDRNRVEGNVVVIGGGSTAVEAARTALRLGASSVQILYRRYREELLADHEEVEAAESEGIRFRFLVAPRRLVKKGRKLAALECVQVGLGEPDASGRRRPIEIPGSEFTVETQRILVAVGQTIDFSFLPKKLDGINSNGRLTIDEKTAMTDVPGIFAAGDAVTGPATVVEAIGAGHCAAESIRHFLQEGKADIREQKPERRAPAEYELPEPQPLAAQRIRPQLLPLTEVEPFDEVELPFTAGDAVAEARRCLRCGPCGECRSCTSSCNRRHIMVRVESGNGEPPEAFLLRTTANVSLAMPTEKATPAWLIHGLRARSLDARLGQKSEVLPVRCRIENPRCRGCTRCVEVCPFGALTKPVVAGDAVRLDPGLCRGCGLCAATCPTGTAILGALSPEWWSDRLDAVLDPNIAESQFIVLACQRRAGSLEKTFDDHGLHVDVIRFRCVGQIDAGMLLELSRQPFKRILVAGCVADRCRFTKGATRAMEQLARARNIVESLGGDSSRIADDWSADRGGDPLGNAVKNLTGGH